MIAVSHADFVEHIGRAIEVAGVALIVAGLLRALWRSWRRDAGTRAARARHDMGQAILLGLEVLVAADIVKTIGLDLTVESLGVLAVLVLIRTFLSWSLTVEIEGRWPWQRGRAEESRARANSSSRTVFATSEDVVREATA